MKQLTRQQFDIVNTSEEDKEVQILQYVIGTLNNFMARVRQTANTQEYNVPSLTLYDIDMIIKECFPCYQYIFIFNCQPHITVIIETI